MQTTMNDVDQDWTASAAVQGSVMHIRGGRGAVLAPRSGVLWVSEAESANDTMVLPGDAYRITGTGPVTVVAHGAARFAIRLPEDSSTGTSVELALPDAAPAAPLRVATAPAFAPVRWPGAAGPEREATPLARAS